MPLITSAQAVRLLAELVDFDRQVRHRRAHLSFPQRQRRQAICMELRDWAMKRRSRLGEFFEKRRNPRAAVRLRVLMLGGPQQIEFHTDSIAIGGVRVSLPFAAHLGDIMGLRLVPGPPDNAVEVTAQVVWADPQTMRAGLQFHDPSEECVALLERLVFAHLVQVGEEDG